jgi:cytochrome c-type biogenesis protein
LSRAAALVAGTALATTALGIIAALAGHASTMLGRGSRYALAFVPIVVGLHLIGVLRLPLPTTGRSWHGRGALAAFATGLFLSLVIGSCGTPVLAAILSYAAYQDSVAYGGLLLFSYGIGNGLPLLILGTGIGTAVSRLSSAAHLWLDRSAGATLVGFGFYLLTRV